MKDHVMSTMTQTDDQQQQKQERHLPLSITKRSQQKKLLENYYRLGSYDQRRPYCSFCSSGNEVEIGQKGRHSHND